VQEFVGPQPFTRNEDAMSTLIVRHHRVIAFRTRPMDVTAVARRKIESMGARTICSGSAISARTSWRCVFEPKEGQSVSSSIPADPCRQAIE